MANIWKEIKKQRLERLKKASKPVDAMPLIKHMMSDSTTKQQKEEIMKGIRKASEEVGKMLLDRAIYENVITEKECVDLLKIFEPSDFASILQAYFNRKDGEVKKDEKIVVMTSKESIAFKKRELIKKKFNVDISCAEEQVEIIKKKHPEEYNKIMKEMKCKGKQ